MKMRFVKGMIIGTMLSAGIAMMYADNMGIDKKKMKKMGKQMAKKIGIY